MRSGGTVFSEAFVPFQRELSVIAVRGRDGEVRTWPITQNWHIDGVLSASLAPATVSDELEKEALEAAQRIADTLASCRRLRAGTVRGRRQAAGLTKWRLACTTPVIGR